MDQIAVTCARSTTTFQPAVAASTTRSARWARLPYSQPRAKWRKAARRNSLCSASSWPSGCGRGGGGESGTSGRGDDKGKSSTKEAVTLKPGTHLHHACDGDGEVPFARGDPAPHARGQLLARQRAFRHAQHGLPAVPRGALNLRTNDAENNAQRSDCGGGTQGVSGGEHGDAGNTAVRG